MQRLARCAILALLPLLLSAATLSGSIDVLFSPHGGCTDAIVREIAAAKRSMRIQPGFPR